MKYHRTMGAALVAATLIAPAAWAKGWFGVGGPETPLEQAHAAFIGKDFDGAVRAVRDVLADEASDVDSRKNAIELIDKIYEVTGGRIRTDWRVPAAIQNMKVTHGRKEEPERV